VGVGVLHLLTDLKYLLTKKTEIIKNFRPFTAILAAMLISAAAIFYSCSKQET
jgi:hypothetical protein